MFLQTFLGNITQIPGPFDKLRTGKPGMARYAAKRKNITQKYYHPNHPICHPAANLPPRLPICHPGLEPGSLLTISEALLHPRNITAPPQLLID